MPSSDNSAIDDLISHIVAGLHASQSLQLGVVEKLLRMSLLQLGRTIAEPPVKKPRKKKLPQQKKPAPVPRDLALVPDGSHEASQTAVAPRGDGLIRHHRPGHAASPRRRPTSRRTGSRG